MRVRMRGKLVGVEQVKKSDKKATFLVTPEDSHTAGIIRVLGKDLEGSDLKVGMKVYYGDKRQPVTIDGVNLLVMDQENILAVEESADETKEARPTQPTQ